LGETVRICYLVEAPLRIGWSSVQIEEFRGFEEVLCGLRNSVDKGFLRI
jgi:hypothetical protein